MTLNVDGTIPSLKSPTSIRLVSFNINGYKTLTHYHPWNDLATLSKIFTYLKSDIITFQELKLQRQDIDRSIACVPNYRTFITIPQRKKGYSGVSIFIKSDIQILKVEEGITGYLPIPNNTTLSYRKNYEINNEQASSSIGGYTDNFTDSKEALSVDEDGRCLIVELFNNIVIICVYCPANSMLDEEVEVARCLFLETLFKRVDNLSKLGKRVVIMGDINVSPSIIDRDDYMNEGLKDKSLVIPADPSESFEQLNKDTVLNFRSELTSRQILNMYLYDTNNFEPSKNTDKLLYDLGRIKNPNRLKMYTCWNTLLNNRPLNIGSRIDLFLATKDLMEITDDCGIWPFLYGSDHCPVYCDLDIGKLPKSEQSLKPSYKSFEAVTYYGLTITKSIDSFFKSTRPKSAAQTPKPVQEQELEQPAKRASMTPLYTSRKIQKGQSTLFSSIITKKPELTPTPSTTAPKSADSLFVQDSDDEDQIIPETQPEESKPKLSADVFNELLTIKSFNSIPQCQHNEPCVLRTTRKGANAGKKFWCCAKPKENSTWSEGQSGGLQHSNGDFSCSYFKWAQK